MTWRTGLTPAEAGVPAGGAAGQMLAKVSGRNFDTEWVAPAGDVVGPASAVDNRVALFDGTSGKLLKDAGVVLNAAGVGLGNVDNTSDLAKPVSTATATALSAKLDTTAAPELIRDTIGAALVAGANVTLTVNDAGDTITIAASGGGSSPVVSAFLTATQANSTLTPAVLTGHIFTLTPGQVLSLTGQVAATTAANTTGLCVGIRVAQASGADANAIGSAVIQVPATNAAASTQFYRGDAFNVAANANSFWEVVSTGSGGGNNTAGYQLSVKNLSTNADTTVTIEFRSEVDTSAVTLQIGSGCSGVKA